MNRSVIIFIVVLALCLNLGSSLSIRSAPKNHDAINMNFTEALDIAVDNAGIIDKLDDDVRDVKNAIANAIGIRAI